MAVLLALVMLLLLRLFPFRNFTSGLVVPFPLDLLFLHLWPSFSVNSGLDALQLWPSFSFTSGLAVPSTLALMSFNCVLA
jgi:hypothetical protein